MAVSSEYAAYIADLMTRALGRPVTIRSMFGGAGVYADAVMFALIAYETLYLKVGPANAARFEEAGLPRFTYEGKGKPMTMSYAQAPEAALEDAEIMADWAQGALEQAKAARRSRGKD